MWSVALGEHWKRISENTILAKAGDRSDFLRDGVFGETQYLLLAPEMDSVAGLRYSTFP